MKNYKSKTELTLAPVMVVMALAANLTFFVSIALRVPAYDEHFWRDIFPFLCGELPLARLPCALPGSDPDPPPAQPRSAPLLATW